jgi:hypothetical protein
MFTPAPPPSSVADSPSVLRSLLALVVLNLVLASGFAPTDPFAQLLWTVAGAEPVRARLAGASE